MKIKGKFVAMLIGENSDVRTRKSDGQHYSFNTVAIMQDGLVDNIRVEATLFQSLKDMEHFVKYVMYFEFNTDYNSFVIMDMQPFTGASGGK